MLGNFRLRTPINWLWPFLVLLVFLPLIEMNLMVLVDGRLYTDIAFPMVRFWDYFGKTLDVGIGYAWSQFISMSVFQVTAVDQHSGLKVWAIYYQPWNVVAHALASILLARIIVVQKTYFNKITGISFLIVVFAILVPCTYIYLIEHCSGSTWLIETMVLATEDAATIDAYSKNIRPVVFVFQIIITICGLAALLILQKTRPMKNGLRITDSKVS